MRTKCKVCSCEMEYESSSGCCSPACERKYAQWEQDRSKPPEEDRDRPGNIWGDKW